MTLAVSVVIPTYRRPKLLERCLDALVKQSLPPHLYEIVVVDDGRSDDTREAVERIAARTQGMPQVRYLQPQGTRGPAGARNRGWRASDAPVIAFTDDDTVPDHDWLHQGLRSLASEYVAVGGRVVVPTSERPTDHEKNTRGLETSEFVTANALVKRWALEEVGGFDERFTRAWREDSDLHFSLISRCGPVGYAHKAVVVHPVREAPWGSSIKTQANVVFDALLFKKHPHLFLTRIRRHPPWRYYVIVACTFAALAAAVMHANVVALWLAGVALLGIIGFAAQRLQGASLAPSHVLEMIVTSIAIPFLAVFWRVVGALRFKVVFP